MVTKLFHGIRLTLFVLSCAANIFQWVLNRGFYSSICSQNFFIFLKSEEGKQEVAAWKKAHYSEDENLIDDKLRQAENQYIEYFKMQCNKECRKKKIETFSKTEDCKKLTKQRGA